MRTWRGAVLAADADLQHQSDTGLREYRETPGNLGVLVLNRRLDDQVEVTTLSLWTSMDAIRAFAGDEPERAKFYPGDTDLLVDKDLHADHYEVHSHELDTTPTR